MCDGVPVLDTNLHGRWWCRIPQALRVMLTKPPVRRTNVCRADCPYNHGAYTEQGTIRHCL